MVTLSQLRAQKGRILARRDEAAKKQQIEFEKIGLQKEIKKLNRSQSSIRNIRFAKRTGRGLKILASKFGRATIRQAKRIKEQQLRDDAVLRKAGNIKKIPKRKKLKTGQNLSKIKEGKGFDVFSNLDF